MDDLMQPTDDDFDSEYEVWCSDVLVAGSSNLQGAMESALVYIDEGIIEVVKVTRTVVAEMKLR